MTGPQRIRLVLALGALNIILATVALGLAGSISTTDETARATASPSASAPAVANGSPSPAPGGEPPGSQPPGSQPPGIEPTPGPSEAPEASEPGSSEGPEVTPGPIAVASGAPPTERPGGGQPTAAPPTAAPPTAAPTPVPDEGQPEPSRARPPCPGSVEGAPGHEKGSGDPTRPCKGGEGNDNQGDAGDDRARGDERGQARVNPCRGRRRREVA